MKILFNLPPSTIVRCFRKTDLDRLAATHDLVLPDFEAEGAFVELAATGRLSGDNPEVAALKRFVGEHLAEVEVMVTGWGMIPLTFGTLAAAKKLRAIVHSAGSIKTLVPEEAWKRGIRVGTCNAALAVGVAETTLGMILCGLKGFFPAREWTRDGKWHDPKLGMAWEVLREPFGLAVGVISASKVGLHVLKLLRAFEMEVLLYDPFMKSERVQELGATLVGLEELIINTARGMIVDEAAMIEELKMGRISAFIDVTDPEPPAKDSPLRSLPNVVLTPHLAGHASNGCFRQGRSALDQVLQFASNRRMPGEVTLAMLATMA